MSKNRNALAFAAGLGTSYMRGKLAERDREEREEDRAWKNEQRGYERERMERERQNQRSLADAVAPRTAVEGTVISDSQGNRNLYKDPGQAAAAQADLEAEAEMQGRPSLAQARPGYGVVGPSVGNTITEQRPDVASLNTPQARTQRVIDATMAQDPARAISLQNATTTGEKARFDLEEAQRKRRVEIEQEGMVAAVRAAQSGDAAAVKDAFNKQGNFKVDGDLKVTPVRRKAPWGGEVDTYDYEGTVVDAEGKKRPVKLNSLDAMVRMVPFKDMFEVQSRMGLEGVKHGNRMTEIGAQGAESRRTAEHRKAIGGDAISREERLRYTSLFQEAGRRMGEAQRALSTLQKDPLYSLAKPGTPQHAELQALRDSIAGYASERSTYQGLLAESQTTGKGGASAPSASPQKVGSKAERDKLPKGARYVGPDGQTYIKQ